MKKISFKKVYLIYVAVLAVAVTAGVMYVNSLLREYENSQPEHHAALAMEDLRAAAADGTFLTTYDMAAPAPGEYEAGMDILALYLARYQEELTVKEAPGLHAEDELRFHVKAGDLALAEIALKAQGPVETKLAVFSMREWTVESVTPILAPTDYTLTLPGDFTVTVNGLACENGAGEEDVTYEFRGLYLTPDLAIRDPEGNPARFTIRAGRIIPEIYHYTLTLPAAITVTVNGAVHEGEPVSGDLRRHEIRLLDKPTVEISDHFGNTVIYDGGSAIPLTYETITAPTDVTVLVDGAAVPGAAVTLRDHPDYAPLAAYAADLPRIACYSIAVLKDNAAITVTDRNGNPLPLTEDSDIHDFTAPCGLAAMPEDIAGEVDVLDIAQKWSLLLSNDLKFKDIAPYLIEGSYQYEVARQYATGVDITFVSGHYLGTPPFTGNTVTNFIPITEDCFSVDISFVKVMHLTRTGAKVEDPMNDRFYFVRHEGSWKLVSMKEIIVNE